LTEPENIMIVIARREKGLPFRTRSHCTLPVRTSLDCRGFTLSCWSAVYPGRQDAERISSGYPLYPMAPLLPCLLEPSRTQPVVLKSVLPPSGRHGDDNGESREAPVEPFNSPKYRPLRTARRIWT